MSRRLTQGQRRSVACPTCGRGAGRPCTSSRIPGPSTLGGGWGGPPELNREHKSRVVAARAKAPAVAEVVHCMGHGHALCGQTGNRRVSTSLEGVTCEGCLAKRVTRLMLSLERAVHAVRKASHAGRCSACSGGEVWTDQPHPDKDREPDLGETGERPMRVLGICPVCNGHVGLDCDVLDCRTC